MTGLVNHHQPTQPIAFHQLHHLHGVHVGARRHQVNRHDVARREHGWVKAFGHEFKHKVTVGHDAHRLVFVDRVNHNQGTDMVPTHQLSHFKRRSFRLNHGNQCGGKFLEFCSHGDS